MPQPPGHQPGATTTGAARATGLGAPWALAPDRGSDIPRRGPACASAAPKARWEPHDRPPRVARLAVTAPASWRPPVAHAGEPRLPVAFPYRALSEGSRPDSHPSQFSHFT